MIKKLLNKIITMKTSVMTAIGASITTLLLSTGFAFADGDTSLIDNIVTQMDTFYLKFVGLSTALAIFLIVIGVLWVMVSPSSKGAATPLGWIRKVIIAWVVIQCLGGLFNIAKTVIDGSDSKIDLVQEQANSSTR